MEELYLRNTSLTEFPRDAAKILGNLKILEIDRHLITKLINSEFDESQITGKLEKLMITNGLLSDMAPNVFQVCIKSLYYQNKIKLTLQIFLAIEKT